jgi:trimeric autotransporter adhesin
VLRPPLRHCRGKAFITTVTVGGIPAQVLFAGMAPGYVGPVQVNFYVPDLTPGDYAIQVTVGTAQSNTPVMSVGN